MRLTAELKYRLLLEISQKISGTLDLDLVLDHLLDAVRSAVPYDAAGIFALNRGAPAFHRGFSDDFIGGMALRGFDVRPLGGDPMLKSGRGIVGHVIRTGESVMAPDVARDPRYVAGRHQTRSEVAVPILIDGRVLGALNLESDRIDAFTHADLDLLHFFANAAAISIERAVLHRQLLDKKRIEHQLEIAREVQASLLPENAPDLPGFDISGVNLPTWQIGGDYFDYVALPGGQWGLAIADVSGKGVPSALIMATFRAALRSQVRVNSDMTSVMRAVNLLLCESIGSAEFVTAVYGVLDPAMGSFRYSNGGHNPPILLRADGATDLLEEGGMALGVFPENEYEAAVVEIRPADTLVLFTDGVVEVTDLRGTEFDTARLEQVLRANARLPAAQIIDSVVRSTQAYGRAEGYADDFTLMVVKRSGEPV